MIVLYPVQQFHFNFVSVALQLLLSFVKIIWIFIELRFVK